MIFSSRHRQDFILLVKPHMTVLQTKALYWTRTQDEADRLLDAFLQRMADNLEALRRSDNLRLLLVRELFEDSLAAEGARARASSDPGLLDKDGILASFLSARQERMNSREG